MTSPVCKCAVPNLKQLSYPDYCQTCGGLPLTKEVKCCESCRELRFYPSLDGLDDGEVIPECNNRNCKCHSQNMTEVMGKGSINSIETVTLKNVAVQANGIVRNEKGYLIARLVGGIEFEGEHVKGMKKEAPNTEASWEYGFDEKFDSRFYGNPKKVAMNPDEVKSFIRSLLLSEKNKAREETLDEVLSWFGKDYDPTSYDWIVKTLEAARSGKDK